MTTTAAPSSDPPGFRSPEMNDELEQLRQRGLAKSLNKHFTQECKKVEAERAAAERALKELEARKASVGDFAPSSHEYSQLEMMYKKVSEWKDECCKREKETVLLYQKMLRKFGTDIKLASPEVLMTPRKDPPTITGAPKASPLVNLDVGSLAEAFQTATNGIPDFLRPTEASSPSSFNDQELEEILEDSSLPDPEAPCKAFVATPRTNSTEDMDSDYDSVVSGLTLMTLNSQVTREVLEGVQTRVMDFIQSETANIRKLMEEQEDVGSKSGPSIAVSQTPSQVGSIEEHENMVRKMEQVLENFKNVETVEGPHKGEGTEKSLKVNMGRRVEAGNEGEEWYEHWDEVFQRNYYVEAHSNTTQWQMPPTAAELSCTSSTTLSASAGSSKFATVTPKVLDYDFKPDVRGGRHRNRLITYKKKQARKRKRQLAAVVFLFAGVVAAFLYYKHVNPEQVEFAIETVSATFTGSFTGTGGAPVSSSARKTRATQAVVKDSQQTKKNAESQTAKKKVEQKEEDAKAPVPDKVESKSTITVNEDISVVTNGATDPKIVVWDAPKAIEQAFVEKAKEIPNEKTQSASRRHWILDVFMGHEDYKKVSELCGEPSRYCGTFSG